MTASRVAVTVRGTVQGVGFRPFVHRVAAARGLSGWVRNEPAGVTFELEGDDRDLSAAIDAVRHASPPARVDSIDVTAVPLAASRGFRILPSVSGGAVRASIPPDLAMCDDCAREVDGDGRRARHPFTSCALCGPRHTIATSAPYDRANTTMAGFAMCAACASEYHDVLDRRFHAQPIACPACGPVLSVGDASGAAAVDALVAHLVRGAVVAMKGLGGYQLLVDATNDAAVATLRARKGRPDRPFAVLFATIDQARAFADVTDDEARELLSPRAPIVLCRRRDGALPAACGPDARFVGVMLPASPLHHLVARGCGRPLVCTSGNVTDEPMCIDDDDARQRLSSIADAFATHDRRVARPVDDSVVQLRRGHVEVRRRARGFAPAPLRVDDGPTVLALGAQQKGVVALALRDEVFSTAHLGDLGTVRGAQLLATATRELLRDHATRPDAIACDLHPDYASSRFAEVLARELGVPVVRVQHHQAHAAACLAEHRHVGRALAFTWDGVGLGDDGTWWGGEALLGSAKSYTRVAHLRPFPLPGGDVAAREPRRAAFGLAGGLDGCGPALSAMFSKRELATLGSVVAAGVATPWTSSVGRLFDAVAALAGVRARSTFEAQAAMELEALATDGHDVGYALPIVSAHGVHVIDPRPLAVAVCRDHAAGVPSRVIAARFHAALAAAAVDVAAAVGEPTVALSGGCFQNVWLTELVQTALEARGFSVLVPRQVPPNDGGIALGQAVVARATIEEGGHVPRAAR